MICELKLFNLVSKLYTGGSFISDVPVVRTLYNFH